MSPRGVGAKDPGELRTANPVDAVPLAVEIALEQARDALVCQRPGDALAALDAVWDVAQRT